MELPQPSKTAIYLSGPELDGYRKAYLGREIGHGAYARVCEIDTTSTSDVEAPLLAKLYIDKPRDDMDRFIQAVHDTGLGYIGPHLKRESFEVMKKKAHYAVAAPLYLVKHSRDGEVIGVAVRQLDTNRFTAISDYYGMRLVDELPISLIAAIRLVLLVTDIHKRGFIIGDFSASNILIDREGHVAIIDCDSFLLAGSGSDGQRADTTINWRAPECKGTQRLTFASDVFVLGLHISKLLFSGIGPFDAPDPQNSNGIPQDNIDANRSWLWDDDIDTPDMIAQSRGLSDLPPRLRTSLRAALSPNPDLRPLDCTELLRALNDTLEGLIQGTCGHYRMYGDHCRYCGSSTQAVRPTPRTPPAAATPEDVPRALPLPTEPAPIAIKPDPPELQPEPQVASSLANDTSDHRKYGCIDYFIIFIFVCINIIFLMNHC